MPSITFDSHPQLGPLVQVLVGVSMHKRQALLDAGLAVPQFVIGTFLIDTGASATCIDPDLVAQLGLVQSGSVQVQTPTTGTSVAICAQYDVSLILFGSEQTMQPFSAPALPIMETQLRPQGIDGLLGRDIIDQGILIHNGITKQTTFSW